MRALQASAGGESGEFAYLEHSAEVVELSRDGRVISTAPHPEDRAAWLRANPALGVRIEESQLAEDFRILGPALFAREHLCVWDPYPGAEGGFLPVDQWEGLVVKDPGSMSMVCFGLSVSSNGSAAVVASAARLSSGDLYIDTVEERTGTDWVIPYLVDLYGRKRKIPIRINPSAPEGAFARPLTEVGVEVIQVTPRQYQQACGEVLDTIKNGTIRHLGQSSLNRAVHAAQRRDIGKDGGWVWADPVSGVDIAVLKAATLALTGVTARRPPRIHVYEEA